MDHMTNEFRHIPVLLDECLRYANLKQDGIYVDATLGGAGHSCAMASLLGEDGCLIGIDQDEMALAAAGARLKALDRADAPAIELLRGNFGDMDELLLQAEVPGVDAFLFDLGVSSPQLDLPARGFSFKEDAPLDMRMDPDRTSVTAADLVNTLDVGELTRIIRDYSDEKWASRIAQFIVAAREHGPIETSGQLVEIIKAAIPSSARRAGGHPAKRTFQALRIEVNAELSVLRRGLEAAVRWLRPKGRIMVISYHSLEDRVVKEVFAAHARTCTCPPGLPVCACGADPVLKQVTRKPVLPSPAEIERNPRARSAKLRVAEKLR